MFNDPNGKFRQKFVTERAVRALDILAHAVGDDPVSEADGTEYLDNGFVKLAIPVIVLDLMSTKDVNTDDPKILSEQLISDVHNVLMEHTVALLNKRIAIDAALDRAREALIQFKEEMINE